LKADPANLIRLSLKRRLFLAMLAVTLLGFLLTGAVTLVGFSRLDDAYNASRLVRKEAAVAKSLGFALKKGVGDAVEAASLSWTVMPGDFADRIVEIEAVQGVPLAVYRLDGGLFVTSTASHPEESGFATEVEPDVLIALAQGAERLEVPLGGGDYLAYWYQLNEAQRPVALVALRYTARVLEASGKTDFLRSLGGVFALVFLAATGLSFLLSRSISNPLSRLGVMMERMDVAKDKGFEPLNYKSVGNDEIARLVEQYNRMAENVRKSAAALAKGERESAWREMAMQVAHEIKNPLTPMKLGIQQMERRALNPETEPGDLRARMVELSGLLQGQIDLLSRIADEFSTMARLPQGELMAISLREVLESVVLLNEAVECGPTLVMEGDTLVMGDRDQLLRLFGNLVLNAQQAIASGPGLVKIVVKSNFSVIEVVDSGPGMSLEVAHKVFEPQFTTRGSGSGLGLAIAKAIADRHSWGMACKTELGSGTTFSLSLKWLSTL
jgi:two-component system nitrogen regulation sensor histidine kinase NtrY